MREWLALVAFLVLCLLVGGAASYATTQSVAEWYPTLNKPDWRPPNWLFGPVWTVLYVMIAVAGWLVWKQGRASAAMAMWAVQLALNFAWSFSFFGAQSPGLGLINIVAMWIAIVATIYLFWARSRLAALLFVPYLCWVSFATALNYSIYMLN
jgi:translocator protein